MMTSRSRCTLHMDKLEEFAKFCATRGWVRHDLNGHFEVLRMKKGREWLLVYTTNHAVEHYTTYGPSEDMARAFVNQKHQ